jgi:hypothetical protein
MTERCDHHQVLTSIGPWLPKRRARPSRPSLTGHFLPAHETPVAVCLNHRLLKAHAPLRESRDAMMRARSSPLISSCKTLPCPSADYPPN